jgi:hypothetical protein
VVRTALVGIAESGDAAAFAAAWWFEPFGLSASAINHEVLPEAAKHSRSGIGCGANNTFIPFALPPGEPDGELLVWPGWRSGLALLLAADETGRRLASLWPFVTNGAEHEAIIERVLLSPDRLQGVIEATVSGALALSWNDIFFPLDRGYYAEGSVHQVLLAGIAHEVEIGSRSPIEITPDDPSYAGLKAIAPKDVDARGTIVVDPAIVTGILPASDSAPSMFSIHGQVKEARRYDGDLFGREVWQLRTTVARLDDDFDIDVFVTDIVLNGRAAPKAGDVISGVVRLQGRIWHPNPKSSA